MGGLERTRVRVFTWQRFQAMSLHSEAQVIATEIEQRRAFEAWISQSPYERSVERWPNDERRHAWPGQYKDMEVQLAWEAWQESRKS